MLLSCRNLEQKRLKSKLLVANKDLTPIEDFLWYLSAEKRLSPKTEESYRQDLKVWSAALKTDFSSAFPPKAEQLREALQLFQSQNLKESTLARRKATLRVFSRFRSLSDIAWAEILTTVPSQKAPDNFPKALTHEEIGKYLGFEPELTDKMALRNKALLELMYASGLRAAEVLLLEWKQVDERLGGLRVLGKGQKIRFVPFTENCLEWLLKYKESAWASLIVRSEKRYRDLMFPGPRGGPLTRMALWKIVHKRGLISGVDDMHPHVLRHTFATHLLKGGADVRFVQVMLGHSSLDTTEKYLRLADDELATLFKEFHPLRNK